MADCECLLGPALLRGAAPTLPPPCVAVLLPHPIQPVVASGPPHGSTQVTRGRVNIVTGQGMAQSLNVNLSLAQSLTHSPRPPRSKPSPAPVLVPAPRCSLCSAAPRPIVRLPQASDWFLDFPSGFCDGCSTSSESSSLSRVPCLMPCCKLAVSCTRFCLCALTLCALTLCAFAVHALLCVAVRCACAFAVASMAHSGRA